MHPESADDWENEDLNEFDEEPAVREREYNKPIPGLEIKPISIEDSKRFGGAQF